MKAVRAARFCQNSIKILISGSIIGIDGRNFFLPDTNQKKEKNFLFLFAIFYFFLKKIELAKC
jgi:hypothetical protein